MIGHVTYLSDIALRKKFDHRLLDNEDINFSFDSDFQVGSYLRHQGQKFVNRFDANSLLYLTKATDYFNLANRHGSGSLAQAFSQAIADYLVVSFSSDWLYPTYQSKKMVQAMKKNNLNVNFCEIQTDYGHDSFLVPNLRLSQLIAGFLENEFYTLNNRLSNAI